MKICIFSRPFHPAVGGLEQIAKTLAIEFVSLGCHVEVVTDTESRDQKDDDFPFKITRTILFKERYFAFRRADIVLFMNFTYAGIPAALLSRRFIALSHHSNYDSSKSLKVKLIELSKRQLSLFFINISVSQFVKKSLPGNSFIAPNAYDDNMFKYISLNREKDFVFCGRLVSDKGANILLDAFAHIVEKFPFARLTIIGDGPEKLALQTQSKLLKIDRNADFTGVLRGENLVKKLNEHACMVIPSLWDEPFGIVALEGIASCDTIISSNRGGLPEAVGICGILIDPTVEKLVEAMSNVLTARIKGIRLPGQPTAEERTIHLAKHSPRRVAQEYLKILKQVVH